MENDFVLDKAMVLAGATLITCNNMVLSAAADKKNSSLWTSFLLSIFKRNSRINWNTFHYHENNSGVINYMDFFKEPFFKKESRDRKISWFVLDFIICSNRLIVYYFE